MTRIHNTCPQLGAECFVREDRSNRHIPFAGDDADSAPSLPEIIGWIALATSFIGLCAGFLMVA